MCSAREFDSLVRSGKARLADASNPAVSIEEFLKPLGLTQTEVAERMQVPLKRLNAIIRGRKAVTPDTALRLERLFGMEAQFWLNLQLCVDLYRAVHSPASAQIRKLRRVPGIAEQSGRVA